MRDQDVTVERTVFDVPKMDCPSEERLVRMALEGAAVQRLDFDLDQRRVTVFHKTSPERLLQLLKPLKFGAQIAASGPAPSDEPDAGEASAAGERSTLLLLLGINAAMFVVEFIGGWIAQSTGLIADSLDMFADAAVYSVSLYAVGRMASSQARTARLSGYLQMLLALGAMTEVGRRFLGGSDPEPPMMAAISFMALVANVTCMALISRHRKAGLHMRASWIFSTNDVVANLGVILAAGLVAMTGSRLPDLVVGAAIASVVLAGAVRILRMSRTTR
jgi:Co/Zn/Cd efflux system component